MNTRFSPRDRGDLDQLLESFFASGGQVWRIQPKKRKHTEYNWFRIERGMSPETEVESVDIHETDDNGARHYAGE